jgi:hypothetical protein
MVARIRHTHSSLDLARTCTGEAWTGFPEGLYGDILPKDNSARNEAGAGRSKSQKKGYEKFGLGVTSEFSDRLYRRAAFASDLGIKCRRGLDREVPPRASADSAKAETTSADLPP